jgi:glycosyltransferase involved in cell wall biosynthesis
LLSAEDFPIALLEAIASGLQAICTNVGSISDSLYDNINGFLLVNNTAECIAEAMAAYLKQPELLILHSRKTLEIFNHQHVWEETCSHIFDQFSE